MRLPPIATAVLCLAGVAFPLRPVQAQAGDSTRVPVLSLSEAITLAIQHNPTHQQFITARRTAGAQLRSAYGALLPSASASLSAQYQQSGNIPISGVQFAVNSDIYQSAYFLGLSYRLSASTFLDPKIQKANVRAADADIVGSRETLKAVVTQDYLTVLQDAAKAVLQDTLVNQAQIQLDLSKAKMAVGSGTQLDVSNAEVSLGQAKVAALQAHNQVEVDKLRLFQQVGIPEPVGVQLTTTFSVEPVAFTLDSLMSLAIAQNPALNALRSREKVAAVSVTSAKMQYLPSLTVSTGWGGYTYEYSNANVLVQSAQARSVNGLAQCAVTDSIRTGAGLAPLGSLCTSQYVFNDQIAQAIRSQNSQFPFNFNKQPFGVTATFSLPIFNGFQREQQIEQARANDDNARYNLQAQSLQLTADVTSAFLTLRTQFQTVALQEQNASAAREGLRLAQEKYRVGAATYLDLANAQATFARAENDRINAVYEYHKAFAALESAVGRSLR
jgi:outer membrane protein